MSEYIGISFITLGVLYDLLACLGLVRMPDIYTRLQTSAKAITVGTSCILLGVVILAGAGSVATKAFLCMVFVLLTIPVSAHVIARAAHSAGIRVERVTAEGLVGRKVEAELWDTTRRGDRFEKNRLLEIFSCCRILDIKEYLTVESLFELVSYPLAEIEQVTPAVVKNKLIQREKEAITALIPDFAIPHIIIEGQGTFEVMVIRAKEGVWFSQKYPKVKSIFIIVGTQDEWHFHLRVLAAVAKVVLTENFFDDWLKAEGIQELRSFIINKLSLI